MKITAQLSDRYNAYVDKIKLENIYSDFIEATPGAYTHFSNRLLNEINQTIINIQSGKTKGRYIIKPQLIDEAAYWNPDILELHKERKRPYECGKCLKNFKIEAHLSIIGDNGKYSITLEWYQTEKELSTTPLVNLIQTTVAGISLEDIKDYCDYFDWEDL